VTATLRCADAAACYRRVADAVANTPDPGGAGPAPFAARAADSAVSPAAASARADADAASEAVATFAARAANRWSRSGADEVKRAMSVATDCERMLLLCYTPLAINAGVARYYNNINNNSNNCTQQQQHQHQQQQQQRQQQYQHHQQQKQQSSKVQPIFLGPLAA
jgi:hypothetical protein